MTDLGGQGMDKKKGQLSSIDFKRVVDLVAKDLIVYDLSEWQKACKAFGPVHYESETRKEWFAKNRFRLDAAKEITEFVESWVKNLRGNGTYEEYTITAIREGIIEAVRKQQEMGGASLGLLNPVKLNGFKTLVKWAENQELLEEGPYEGAIKIPEGGVKKSTRRPSRRKRKGKYGPPIVNLANDYLLVDENRLQVSIMVGNDYIHPYQNVMLELAIDPRLSVVSVSDYSWSPRTNTIPIGFLEASLEEEMKELVLEIDLIILDRAKEYNLTGCVIYDDCEKGIVSNHDLASVIIKLG